MREREREKEREKEKEEKKWKKSPVRGLLKNNKHQSLPAGQGKREKKKRDIGNETGRQICSRLP